MSKVDGQVDADADAAGRASEGGGGGASVKSKSNIVSPLDLSTSNFPSLLYAAHPLLDSGHTTSYKADERYFAADHHLTHFSSRGVIPASPPSAEFSARVGLGPIASASAGSAEAPDSRGNRAAQQLLAKVTPLSVEEIAGLFRHVLAIDRVVRQTGKGKIPKMRALVLAGNGRGLIGVGTAKDEIANMAVDKAFKNAVTNMDYIDRFEGRTVHATMEAKWGATRVTLRPRPPGFGLRVPPAVHAFARCVGISDLSASIEGSTNRHATVYALLNVLAGGPGNPIGMGDGLGGPARRMDKGVGMKPVKTLEWERGRRFKSVLQ
ncbi:hypothetical protein IE81DRAFT_295826 [Ceraceosorus guamensis]|uniref:S5 DRBM domain-containing protein n=1 Tax=Ceraceosorus guamensis TaxID=1522189 RepID=A0A316VN92_9BASI|nr:hypothetical protein IE81DRAFT_295826 [Ceraceosorus guamensis]PWN38774.1 hypothetical protein IE81DRAFT_295826 [Ceraceosorus guamensis]